LILPSPEIGWIDSPPVAGPIFESKNRKIIALNILFESKIEALVCSLWGGVQGRVAVERGGTADFLFVVCGMRALALMGLILASSCVRTAYLFSPAPSVRWQVALSLSLSLSLSRSLSLSPSLSLFGKERERECVWERGSVRGWVSEWLWVCVCACEIVCVRVRESIWLCMCVCMCVCMYVCVYVCVYICVCVCGFVGWSFTYARKHTRAHTRMQTRTHFLISLFIPAHKHTSSQPLPLCRSFLHSF